MHRSKSQLATYDRCPRAYRYRYVEQIKTSNAWAVKGRAAHAAVAQHYQAKLDTGTGLSVPDCLDVFDEELRTALEDPQVPVILFEGQTPETIREDGRAQLATYLQVLAPTIEPLMVEERVSMTTPGGVELIGYLDLVDVALTVHDTKFPTDRMKAEALHYEPDPPLYAALVHAQTGRWPRVVFDVVARGRAKVPKPSAETLEVPIRPELVAARLADLEVVDQAITAGVFPRRPSTQNCAKCAFVNLCWWQQKPPTSVHFAERQDFGSVPMVTA